MKTKIILVSHGNLAEGMAHSAQMIAGVNPNLSYYGLQPGDHPSQIFQQIKNIIDNNKEWKFIIVVDIFGGSVCNNGMELLELENVRLLSGMNLSLVVELLITGDCLSDEDVQEKIQSAQQGIMLFSKSIVADTVASDKDFF